MYLYIKNAWKPLADLKLLSLNQQLTNLKPGTLSFSIEADSALVIGKYDVVALHTSIPAPGEQILFCGKITSQRLVGKTIIEYQAEDVLFDLEHIIYQVIGGDNLSTTRVFLFRNTASDPISSGYQIELAIGCAAVNGIAIDTNADDIENLDLFLPAKEVSEYTVFEVLKSALVYNRDISCFSEYYQPGEDTIIRFLSRENMTDFTIYDGIKSVEASARFDLQVEGVIIKYLWTDTDVDGVETPGSEEDSFGVVTGINVLRQTVPLVGSKEVTTASYTLDLIYDRRLAHSVGWNNSAGQPEAEAAYNFYLTLGASMGLYPPGVTQYPTTLLVDSWPYKTTSPDNYLFSPAEVADIPPWVLSQIDAQPFYGKATFYAWNGSSWIQWKVSCPYSAGYMAINNGLNREYTTTETFPADPIPAALAEQLYNMLNPMQYDGQIIRYCDLLTVDGVTNALRRLNIGGYGDEILTMRAIIQSLSFDYMSQIQSIRFGTPEHLEPADFIALCRINRQADYSVL